MTALWERRILEENQETRSRLKSIPKNSVDKSIEILNEAIHGEWLTVTGKKRPNKMVTNNGENTKDSPFQNKLLGFGALNIDPVAIFSK